jgi:hypothetical protein
LRERRALVPFIAACLIAPLIDGVLVAANGRVLYALSVHGTALAYGAVLHGLLVRENSKRRPSDHVVAATGPHCARSPSFRES